MYLENKITARELRLILFNILDQEMTVRELRKALYDIPGQDEVINYTQLENLKNLQRKVS